jgi:MFS family permease
VLGSYPDLDQLLIPCPGNIASIVVQKTFKKQFGVDHETEAQYANTKGWLVSIATAGAVFGCLACINLVQLWGRKNTMLVFTIIYIGGIFGQTFANGSLSAMYASRFISGIGIGTTTVIPSIYITEVGDKRKLPRTYCTMLTTRIRLRHAA